MVPIAEVLQLLDAQKQSGALQVDRGKGSVNPSALVDALEQLQALNDSESPLMTPELKSRVTALSSVVRAKSVDADSCSR